MFAQEIVAHTTDGDEQHLMLSYSENDPYAVTLSIPQGTTFVDWKFARDLLLDVFLDGRSGLGDVKLVINDVTNLLSMTLSWSGEEVLLTLPAEEVKIFVQQTTNMVPVGQESTFLDLDAELEQFLKDLE